MAREFTIDDRKLKKNMKKVNHYLETKFPREVLSDFKANTPKDKGNARSKTKLKRTSKGHEIVGDYPYSGVIDKGLYPNPPKTVTGKTRNGYSTQAPKGIVEPTLKQAESRFKRFIRRIR